MNIVCSVAYVENCLLMCSAKTAQHIQLTDKFVVTDMNILIVVTSISELSFAEPESHGSDTHHHILDCGWNLPSCAVPYNIFRFLEYNVVIASPAGGSTTIDPASLRFSSHYKCQAALSDPGFQSGFEHSRPLSSLYGGDFKAILFADGIGATVDFRSSPFVDKVARECYESGGIVATIGHGSAALANIHLSDRSLLISGKQITGSTNEEDRETNEVWYLPKTRQGLRTVEDFLSNEACYFAKQQPFDPHAVVDGRVITGQNHFASFEVVRQIVLRLTEH